MNFFTLTCKNRFNDSAKRTRASVAEMVISRHYSPRPT